MSGSSIFDYIHPQDHAEVAEQLGLGLASNQNLASPSSAVSDDNGTNQGTNNPDGKYSMASSSFSDVFFLYFSRKGSRKLFWFFWPQNSNSNLIGNISIIRINFTVATPMLTGGQSAYKGYDRAFCVRMKSTLTKRGCHFKSSGYRVSKSQAFNLYRAHSS